MKRAIALMLCLVATVSGCAAESVDSEEVGDGEGAVKNTLALTVKKSAKDFDTTLAKRLSDLLQKQDGAEKTEEGDEASVTLTDKQAAKETISCESDKKQIVCKSSVFAQLPKQANRAGFFSPSVGKVGTNGVKSLNELLYDAVKAEASAQSEQVKKKKLKEPFAVALAPVGKPATATLQASDFQLVCSVDSKGFAPQVGCSVEPIKKAK